MSRKTIMTNIAYDTERRSFYVTMRSKPLADGSTKRMVRCYPTLEQAIQALEDHTAGRKLGGEKREMS